MSKLILCLALVALCSSAATAFLFSSSSPAWNDIRGSFLIAKDEAFAKFPNNTNDPKISSENWVATSNNDCSNGGRFNGYEYIKQGDDSVGLLYDVKGTIAGIQFRIDEALVKNGDTYVSPVNYAAIPSYQRITQAGKNYLVITAYFVPPSTICTDGRTLQTLSTEGTGTGLWIQNGTSPTQTFKVPDVRPNSEDESANKGWTKNNCFPAMGYHNFYSINQYRETNCSIMVPIFGLYSNNQLHGFGFITPGNITGPRIEHPPEPAVRAILGADNIPDCVIDITRSATLSSLHVYFKDRPWFITCPPFSTSFDYLNVATQWIGGLISNSIFG